MDSRLRLSAAIAVLLAISGCATAAPAETPGATPSQAATPAGSSATPAGSAAPSTTAAPQPTTTSAPGATASARPSPTASAPPTASPTASPAPAASPSPVPAANSIEVVAGGGTEAPRNGLAATLANLVRPTGVAVAPDGTLWIVDANLALLMHVLTDGTLADVASGLYGPEGVAAALDGNVYVANRGAYGVVSPNGNGGIVQVAGNPLKAGFSGDGKLAKRALLFLPHDIATDGASNGYIADAGNQRIRLIDAGTLKIRTIAGSGTRGFDGDGGQALDAAIDSPQAIAVDQAGSVLLIGDTGNGRLRRADLTTGLITTIAGSGGNGVNYDPALTGLETPVNRLSALAMDVAGNAYFPVLWGDIGHTIMRLAPDGTMTRVVGGGRLTDPGVAALDFALPDVLGLAVDAATGDLFICGSDGRVYRIRGVAAAAVQ